MTVFKVNELHWIDEKTTNGKKIFIDVWYDELVGEYVNFPELINWIFIIQDNSGAIYQIIQQENYCLHDVRIEMFILVLYSTLYYDISFINFCSSKQIQSTNLFHAAYLNGQYQIIYLIGFTDA